MLSVTTRSSCTPCEEKTNPCYDTTPVVSEFAPCYTDGICEEGCEDSYNSKCVVVKVDLPHLGTFSGATLETVLLKIDTLLQDLLPQVNNLIPAPVYNYHATLTCVNNVTLKRNGVTIGSALVFADEAALLTYLQSVDPLWELDAGIFKIKSIYDWELICS